MSKLLVSYPNYPKVGTVSSGLVLIVLHCDPNVQG